MFSFVKKIGVLWAVFTGLSFAAFFYLAWVYGSPAAWQPEAAWSFFALFLPIGFASAVFWKRKWHTSFCALWVTLLFLWGLSLTVPILSSYTDYGIDMLETASEMAFPLAVFSVFLMAGWLSHGVIRLAIRLIFLLFVFLYILTRFTYIGYFEVSQALISANMLLALAQTNMKESLEFIEVNLSYVGLLAGVLALFALGAFLFRLSAYEFLRPFRQPFAEKGIVFLFLVLSAWMTFLAVPQTLLSKVMYEARETLLSFVEYQAILANRANRKIKDPVLISELAEVPDGVYVLIIGESLNRDHMNVYGYPRENTPFQTEAAFDYHYTFFDKGYASYTQTVQVLTYALTEKNQYNEIKLSDAFSLIDMARAAGFKTTWISNQSRYGVWDTPIGAIGSTCDVQYWVNEYIGTHVITKDYDEALIPYLAKVDPGNRRQLIVVHLMGSHISYWDRYPSNFYKYPLDCDLPRTKNQIMTDEYDNTVYYNDYVIRKLMEVAIDTLDADGVLYFSDHGDKVCERPGHNADMFDFAMVHVPIWTYTSDRYIAMHPETFDMMKVREHTAFTNDMIYDTMLGFMGIRAVHYDAGCDLFGAFDKLPGMLMTMHGNIWLDKDTEGLGDWRAYLASLSFPEGSYKEHRTPDVSSCPSSVCEKEIFEEADDVKPETEEEKKKTASEEKSEEEMGKEVSSSSATDAAEVAEKAASAA